MRDRPNTRPLIVAGVFLGIGLGGFADGIILHQVLQWHHMLTSAGYPPTTVGNLELNTLADGLFHAFAWVMTLVGVVLLWRAARMPNVLISGRALLGSVLAGWGLFNLVEGLVNHHLLGIHHVRPGANELAYDLGFLALGAALLLGGWLLARSSPGQAREVAPARDGNPMQERSDRAA